MPVWFKVSRLAWEWSTLVVERVVGPREDPGSLVVSKRCVLASDTWERVALHEVQVGRWVWRGCGLVHQSFGDTTRPRPSGAVLGLGLRSAAPVLLHVDCRRLSMVAGVFLLPHTIQAQLALCRNSCLHMALPWSASPRGCRLCCTSQELVGACRGEIAGLTTKASSELHRSATAAAVACLRILIR